MKRSLLILLVICASLIGAVVGTLLTLKYYNETPAYYSIADRQSTLVANNTLIANATPAAINFEAASRLVTPAVVHIRTIFGPGGFSLNPLDLYRNPHAQSSGSGVIISDDGYIATNYHVIEDATSVEVVMNNNQKFYAKVIGKDPTTDLALLKIKAKNLPFVRYGNSDAVVTGEWVLAIGNPFDLNSTVTAGIVSAKARNINILQDRNNLQVESFIQTDAAVNPGNSGGALVNLRGELIGINAAIATSTGTYAGYSFAIPVSLVKKIMDDLLEFGKVKRGLLGVRITDVTAELAEDQNLKIVRGVFINFVNKGSAAEAGGLLQGDVITAINGNPVNSVSEMQEWVARNRPGHQIEVTYVRKEREEKIKATLKDFDGSSTIQKQEINYQLEGATFEDLSYRELTKLGLDGGVLIKNLSDGRWKKSGLRENFIITHIDKLAVDNVEDLNRILDMKNGGILIEGLYYNGTREVYGVDWAQ